mmetsp:Transcript_28736/g.82557  ORF Transcript_28736/g.82557 Transcript_28736/m.82557 type:complete len:226 (-) Transcript_28736:180-857(-)
MSPMPAAAIGKSVAPRSWSALASARWASLPPTHKYKSPSSISTLRRSSTSRPARNTRPEATEAATAEARTGSSEGAGSAVSKFQASTGRCPVSPPISSLCSLEHARAKSSSIGVPPLTKQTWALVLEPRCAAISRSNSSVSSGRSPMTRSAPKKPTMTGATSPPHSRHSLARSRAAASNGVSGLPRCAATRPHARPLDGRDGEARDPPLLAGRATTVITSGVGGG